MRSPLGCEKGSPKIFFSATSKDMNDVDVCIIYLWKIMTVLVGVRAHNFSDSA